MDTYMYMHIKLTDNMFMDNMYTDYMYIDT